jgi:membrane-associated phospholipid phosphatase
LARDDCSLEGGGMKSETRDVVMRYVAAAAVAILPLRAEAGVAGPPAPRPAAAPSALATPSDGARTMRRLPANLGRGLIGVVSPDNLGPLLVGGMAASTASLLDDDARQELTGQLEWSEEFETAGGPVWSTLFVAGMFGAGRFAAPGGRFRAMTYDMLDAAVVSAVWSGAVKVVVGRERPDGSDDNSFPSGHTSNAFAMATVFERHYGWKLAVPAYALAGLMGVSRLNEDRHWLSDVVAGATIGYVVGRTVARVNGRDPDRAGVALAVGPILAPHTRGLQVSGTF